MKDRPAVDADLVLLLVLVSSSSSSSIFVREPLQKHGKTTTTTRTSTIEPAHWFLFFSLGSSLPTQKNQIEFSQKPHGDDDKERQHAGHQPDPNTEIDPLAQG